MAEFLPLCDVLFNVISLAGYFCDVVFDVVMGYALLERGYKCTFAATISIVVTSLVISQVLSLRWYLHVWWAGEGRKGRPPWLPILLHCLQVGVLWRYARLLVPVELRRVKHQVRDLCMLRLVHAFCEAAPMLLLQLHILFKDTSYEPLSEVGVTPEPSIDEPSANRAFAELNVISASLSLFSVCWALASFSKNVRLQNVHRLVLTWLGVIFQFLWRLGTISARICALTVYALVYEYWVFLVIGLHWVSMFLWLISPRNVFHGERISRPRKAYLSALIAFVYVFAYVNLQELNHRQKMVIFYCVMCVENWVLVSAWWWSGRAARPAATAAAAAAAFCAGLAFMLIYYRYFHVRRLGYMLGENRQGTNSTNASSQNKNGDTSTPTENAAIPGVFNCRFSNPGGSSENEGSSVGSRVNIQQKLQEKKQKQLAELRVIEEEIKQGKLAKTTPVAAEEIYSSLQRQPIPRAKTHAEPPAWPSIEMTHSYQNYPVLPHTCNLYPTYTEIKPEYSGSNFQNNDTAVQNDIKMRMPNIYNQEARGFYENPANMRERAPGRSPNYLALETRNYDSNVCRSPRNVMNSSPRTAYISDVNNSNYDTSALDKTRLQNPNPSSIYSEDHRQSLGEFSGYC
ncbi:XK-related protein 6 [Papilio xuthus]|uniref:XK-related protein n=1 Tax=Papilio xuthus TaxID=66420 RepID=A0A194Q647_PAPXU|nr:XK-related protein 6 [Papilio xuthus]